jgi:SAM-dependent methyltransferase
MINDHVRTAAYVEVLRRYITKESIVLDIGTGPGLFALLAAELGAKKVYAIEPSVYIEIGKQEAAKLGHGDRIAWLRNLSTEVELPEKANLIVGDLHGTLPIYPGNLESFADANRRHLAHGGRVVPSRDLIWVAPAHAPHEYQRIQSPWLDDRYGVRLEAASNYLANTWWRAEGEPVSANSFVGKPALWTTIEYDSKSSAQLSGFLGWTAESAKVIHGFYVWFDSQLDAHTFLSNAPFLPELTYGRAFFPLAEPLSVAVGDAIELKIDARLIGGEYMFRWRTRVRPRHGSSALPETVQSTFHSTPIGTEQLRALAPNFNPKLSSKGHMALQVLNDMATGNSFGTIAARLVVSFPDEFCGDHEALKYVVSLGSEFGA